MLTENLADLLFEIGKEQNDKAMYRPAVQWLERAHEMLRSRSLEELSNDAGDLQTSILYTMVQALMKTPEDKIREKAWNIANTIDAGPTEKLPILLLKLDLIETNSEVDPQDYCDILLRVIRTIHVTDSTFKTTLYYIHKLRSRSSSLAHTVLEQFLLQRLPGTEKPEWVERLVVTIVWNLTTSTSIEGDQNLLKQILDALPYQFQNPIGASATHAAQTVRDSP